MNDQWLAYFRHYAEKLAPAFALKGPWNYKDDITMLGQEMLLRETGEAVFRQSILKCGEALCDGQGHLRRWDDEAHNLDFVSLGKSLWVLYRLTGNPVIHEEILKVRQNLSGHPRVSSGNYWHKDIYPNQVWLDGLYMALPFQAETDIDCGRPDFSDIFDQFRQVRAHHYVPETGLYLHAWDESRQMDWCDRATGLSPCYWLRAEGWLLMAMCDLYELVRDRTPEAAYFIELLQEALDGLLPYQDAETGMFYQLIDRKDLPDNYLETSGSAMAAYAMLKGARLGMLDSAYAAQGADILEGIRRTYLKEEGVPVLYGICASAGLGPGPDHRTDRDGTPRYYLSEKQIPDNQHGAAPCMMAAAECLKANL
ncbi:MAG: glycoside hydrolase family 88 protein [Clostridia bacterium]|nr:glycoside hydrolase family 88 protein [Clostridia bacterium]